MKVKKNLVARLYFTLYTADNELVDRTDEAGYEVLIGDGSLPAGVAKMLMGKEVGDHFSRAVGPKDGYGDYDADLVDTIPRSQFEDPEHPIEVGADFVTEIDGNPVLLRVTEIEGDKVTVDANHPLAGLTITWNVEVLDLREATADELENGLADDHDHDHGDCGHDHAPGESCSH